MPTDNLRNLNISSFDPLPSPREIRGEIPTSELAQQTVVRGRKSIEAILSNDDHRLLLVVGPCSIHDPHSAIEYAQRLFELSKKVQEQCFLVMRVYFEKPRTTVGWKGFINDPHLNDSFEIDQGLRLARKLLADINEIGVPVGTEALDPIVPQFIDDLLSWTAIGARTVESQTHREMASGLSTPVGFKNGTDGNIEVMVNALQAVSSPHHFLGIDQEGKCSTFRTTGNAYAHAVLRGGGGANYSADHVAAVEQQLEAAGIAKNIMIDCSHGNSGKQPELQPAVFKDCLNQVVSGTKSIKGLMVESHLHWGKQELKNDASALQYGISITDACIDWDTTEELILSAAEQLARR